MKKMFSFFLCFIIIISSLSVLSSANSEVTIVSVSAEVNGTFIENFDSTEYSDFDAETNSMSETYQYYDLYDLDPVLTFKYSDSTESSCVLSQAVYETGVYPIIESDQSHLNAWGAGNHEFTVRFEDVSCVVPVEITPCPYTSVSIEDNGSLFITLTLTDGGNETYEADTFDDSFTSGIGNDVGYLYTKQERVFKCAVKYFTEYLSETEIETDRTRDFSLVFGAFESNVISGARWYDGYFKKSEILTQMTAAGITDFDSSRISDDYGEVTALALAGEYFNSNNSVNSGVKVQYDGSVLSASAGEDTVKRAFKNSFGISDVDFDALADYYNGNKGVYETSIEEFDPRLAPDILSAENTDEGCIFSFCAVLYPDEGGIYPEIGDVYYAYFDKNNALLRITYNDPHAPADELGVRPGYGFVSIDKASGVIYISPRTPSFMTAGELTPAFDRYVDTKCAEGDVITNGMHFECVTRIYLVVLLGDLDSDGRITAADARNALRISARLAEPDEMSVFAGDLNNDGFVSASESRAILRFAARLDAELEY